MPAEQISTVTGTSSFDLEYLDKKASHLENSGRPGPGQLGGEKVSGE
jgi:hypothetical protein